MLDTILLNLPVIFFLLVFVGLIVFCVWYLKAFYAGRAEKQKAAEEQRRRHGGESVLEWSEPYAQGEPDSEFGRLVVQIPKRIGGGAACFYEKGVVLGAKRLPYSQLKDVVFLEAEDTMTLRDAIKDSGALWLYPKKGSAIALRGLNYQFDNAVMEAIKNGLGFRA